MNTVEDERYHLQNEWWLWWCLGSLLLSTGTAQIKYFAGCTHTHTRLLNTRSEYLLFCIDLPLHRLADLQNRFIFVWSGYSNVYNWRKMWMNDTCLLVWIDALDKTEACFDGFTLLRVSFFCHCQCSVAILMELENTKQSNYTKNSQPK